MGKSLSNPGREPGDTRKLGERVAAAIENEIMARGWPVGEVLGSEAHLIERFGVSRAVLREAVRIVESHHVARMRRGPNGGLIVSAPEMGAVQASAARFLDYADVSQEDLFVVRSVLELASIRQVIDRLDESIIAALRGALSEERILFAEHGITLHRPDIHVLIARLSGNPALWLFVDVLDNLTQHRTKRQVPRDLDLAEELHRTHTGIVEAIIAGDAPLAQHRMSRHLDAMSGFYR
jgi:DNA-binding FadR family transcriptional regulator